jgi:hypothetical protein
MKSKKGASAMPDSSAFALDFEAYLGQLDRLVFCCFRIYWIGFGRGFNL